MQSIFSMAMCSTRNWWSYYCRKGGKQTLESTDIFATCTHTKGKTQCPDGILQIINWRSPALGRLSSFVFISSLAQTCLPLPFPVFVCEALCSSEPTAWQAHSTQGFGYPGMSLILPASAQLQASGSFGKIIDLQIIINLSLSFLFCIWFAETKMLAVWGFRKLRKRTGDMRWE